MFKTAPLPSSFMLFAILGFLISIFYSGKLGPSWSFTLAFLFIIMFIAATISMSHTPISQQEALEKALISKEKRAESHTVLTHAPKKLVQKKKG